MGPFGYFIILQGYIASNGPNNYITDGILYRCLNTLKLTDN
eukprot:UN09996